jgi:pyruvyltransferase
MVRGPLTREFLMDIGIDVPEIYGDPALLLPLLFPELEPSPMIDYIVIPHISEITLVDEIDNIILPTLHWKEVVAKILESKFVISSSLHRIILAEAFGIPARLLRITQNEPLFKYADYYAGTGRNGFVYAESVEEALIMGGEPPPCFDSDAMLKAFPKDYFFE